jgi:glycosyltransferase involved in cell wall biosynthesis
MLRIALYHNLPSGGAKRAVYEWTRRLAAEHKIDVFTLSSADHSFCDIRPFVQQHRVFDFSPRPLFASPLGRLNQVQRWRDLGDLMQLGRRIAREIDANGYDIVFAQPCLSTFIPAMLQFTRTPSAYYLHEPFGRTFVRQFQRPYMKRNGWREAADQIDPLICLYHHRLLRIQAENIKRTTQLLSNSEFTRQCIRLEFNIDAPVCHYGVNTDGFRPLPEVVKGDCVVSVGEMTPRKGFDFLVESLALIPENRRPELRLACNYQDPDERQYIEELAARRNVRLHVLTHLDTHQLAIEYNRALLCVYSPVMEPFGLVPLEAMACGTPVVGVREGGVRETVLDGETGLVIERDSSLFADAVASLLADAGRRARYGNQGRVYVETQWQWEQSVHHLEQHLVTIAQRQVKTD